DRRRAREQQPDACRTKTVGLRDILRGFPLAFRLGLTPRRRCFAINPSSRRAGLSGDFGDVKRRLGTPPVARLPRFVLRCFVFRFWHRGLLSPAGGLRWLV